MQTQRTSDGSSTRPVRLLLHAPIALVLAWWILDLQVHWRTLVEFQHGWLVPLLAAYLAWERLPMLPPSVAPRSYLGPILLAIVALPFLLVSELYRHAVAITPSSSFALSIGCAGFLISLLWTLHGAAVARRLAFPILFMFVAVPIPRILWNPVVLGLQGLITFLNVETLNLLGIPAARAGNLVRLPNCTVGVDEACSGIRSLQASIMAALFIADLTLRRGSVKLFFFIAGMVLAVLGNFGRSLYLSLTAARSGVTAVEGVHDAAGWSVLLFTAVGLVFLSWMVVRAERGLARDSAADADPDDSGEPVTRTSS